MTEPRSTATRSYHRKGFSKMIRRPLGNSILAMMLVLLNVAGLVPHPAYAAAPSSIGHGGHNAPNPRPPQGSKPAPHPDTVSSRTYWFTWFDSIVSNNMDWILVANPTANTRTATAQIYIGGQ